VRSYRLGTAMRELIPRHKQDLWPQPGGKDVEICRISEVPLSQVAVRVRPTQSYSGAAGQITSEDAPVIPFTMSRNPQAVPVKCGTYAVSLRTEPGTVRPAQRYVAVRPPGGGTADFEVVK
jgi:hypothetical protein